MMKPFEIHSHAIAEIARVVLDMDKKLSEASVHASKDAIEIPSKEIQARIVATVRALEGIKSELRKVELYGK